MEEGSAETKAEENAHEQVSPGQSAASATASSAQSTLKIWRQKAGRFFNECSRVLKITKKPSKHEFWTTVKITGLGILAIGLIGFLISTIQIIVRNIFTG